VKRSRAIKFALFAALCLLFGNLAIPAASAAQRAGCLPNPKKNPSILFVHGLFGKGTDWRPFIDYTNSHISDVQTEAFDYSVISAQWVANSGVGSKLADHITCMHQASGKPVVVVAHSMGGLATREAIKEQPQILRDLGMVFTIATPNTGSDVDGQLLDTARSVCGVIGCTADVYVGFQAYGALPALATGSKQLAALPDWPKSLPVYAIAGNIVPHYNLFGLEFNGPPSGTDSLVTTGSALHDNKAGKSELRCTATAPILPFVTYADCEHGALINNSAVQAEVAKQIKAYLKQAVPAPAPQRKLPETCPQTVTVQSGGTTYNAIATVMAGTSTCTEATALARALLESTSRSAKIGAWTCQFGPYVNQGNSIFPNP
jgi:pimeloyl-ACP methyl ester carboxylesterase